LTRSKSEQRTAFAALRDEFASTYNQIKQYDISAFINPEWESNNAALERLFVPVPRFDFLNIPLLKGNMFVDVGGTWLEDQLSLLERKVPPAHLKKLLVEDLVGEPPLRNTTYRTSHNSIHHLYHLFRFADETQCDFQKIQTVVEWGGGYGNLAKLFRRIEPATYCIIDTPLFSAVQWLYLSAILGAAAVNLLRHPEDSIQAEKVNLVPVCFVENLKVQADLFISTWALSESSKYSQDYVVSRRWFDANHLLLAYSSSNDAFPDASRLGEIAAQAGAARAEIEFLSGNYYAFR
jgi:hypothetical protein